MTVRDSWHPGEYPEMRPEEVEMRRAAWDAEHGIGLTDEQHAIRARRIGASEVGALFGLDPYCTRWELWMRKAGHLPAEDLSDNDSVFWGTVLEPAVARGFALRTGWRVRKAEENTPHPSIPVFGSSLDYEIVEHPDGPAPLEIKTAGNFAFKLWSDGQPPIAYQLQLQAQLACTGWAWGVIAALVGGNALHVFRYDRHPAAIAKVEAEVVAFWRSIEEGREPRPDWQADADAIARLFPTTTPGKAVDLSGDAEFSDLCRAYAAWGRQKADAERQQRAIKAQLVSIVGDAASALGEGCRVVCRDVPEKSVSYTRRGYRDVRVVVDGEKEEA